jgi:hypothetical protein
VVLQVLANGQILEPTLSKHYFLARYDICHTLFHGQTLAKRTKPGPSFQLLMRACVNVDKSMNTIKTA